MRPGMWNREMTSTWAVSVQHQYTLMPLMRFTEQVPVAAAEGEPYNLILTHSISTSDISTLLLVAGT